MRAGLPLCRGRALHAALLRRHDQGTLGVSGPPGNYAKDREVARNSTFTRAVAEGHSHGR
jgi:hypothetical protein